MTDEVLKELWRVKDKIAEGSDYNIKALASKMQQREAKSKRRIVTSIKSIEQATAKQ